MFSFDIQDLGVFGKYIDMLHKWSILNNIYIYMSGALRIIASDRINE